MSNYATHVKSCHLLQIMPLVPNHAKSCQFMSNHVIHVKSCHSCQIMSFVIGFSENLVKSGAGEGGREGQICLPKPSATASLSGRRQKKVNALGPTQFNVQQCQIVDV
jgi:hypothetical protein